MSIYSFNFFIALALAGALGACARYGVDRLFHQLIPTSFPSGIMLVNLSGAFFVGWITAAAASGWMNDPVFVVISFGFAGSYTTFSGWMVQSVELFESGFLKMGLSNLFLSIVPGWLLTLCGWWLGMVF